MTDQDGDMKTTAANTDWQAFVAILDSDILRRLDEVAYQLPPTASPEAVIAQVDSLISGAGTAHDHGGRLGWNAYVDDVLQLAKLRNSLRAWFFERGGYENPNLNAYIANLVLDSRTRLVHTPPSAGRKVPGSVRNGMPEAFMTAAPVVLMLVALLAVLSAASTMALSEIFGSRDATAAVVLCLVVAALSIGGGIGATRQGVRAKISAPMNVAPEPRHPARGRGILVTRDSVCMADDVDAPHAERIEIDPDADALGIAGAILAAGYLPAVAGGSTWSVRLGDAPDADIAVFGHRLGGSFSHRVDGGTATLRSTNVARLDIRYHRQERPTDVIGGIAVARRSATEGSA